MKSIETILLVIDYKIEIPDADQFSGRSINPVLFCEKFGIYLLSETLSEKIRGAV